MVLSRGALLTTADLPLHVREMKAEGSAAEATTFTERVEAFEQAMIHEALGRADGVQTRAARLLGMSERHLRYKLQKYGL